jgi:hypothetical protein
MTTTAMMPPAGNPPALAADDERFLRGFIARSHWRFATTYAKTAPHYYTVNPAERGGSGADFVAVVLLIRAHGVDRQFWSKTFRYLDFEGHSYWECGGPPEDAGVINRVPLPSR